MEFVIGAQITRAPQKMAPRNMEPVLVVTMSQGQQVVALQSHQEDQCLLNDLSNDIRHGKSFERSDYPLWRAVHII